MLKNNLKNQTKPKGENPHRNKQPSNITDDITCWEGKVNSELKNSFHDKDTIILYVLALGDPKIFNLNINKQCTVYKKT